jgi:uncharacterized repeat protein (TIGR01451 family)
MTIDTSMAQVAPPLGTAQGFAVLGSSTVTNTGATTITGNLGVSPGSAVTGFPPGVVSRGTIHAADSPALQARIDAAAAYDNLTAQACDTTYPVPTDIGGMLLLPGVYCFASSAQVTGVLTLDAGGDPNAVWVFKTESTLTTAGSSSLQLINGGQSRNVFWRVGSSATIGTYTSFRGSILALASITLTTGATVSGRALAHTGAVTMDSNSITLPLLQNPPTVVKTFAPGTIDSNRVAVLAITLGNANSDDISGTAFSDIFPVLPGQMVVATPANISNSCGGTVATAGGNSLSLSGGIIPRNGSCTITVSVSAAVKGSYTNTSGIITSANSADGASSAADLTVSTPLLSVTKSATVAAAAPGQEITYSVLIQNPNPSTLSTITAMDSMSPYTALKLNSFLLSDGIPVSGLTLGSGVVSYSSNNGSSWSYVPVSGQGGQPAGYDGTVTNWKLEMIPAEAMNGSNGAFTIRYTVRTR